MTGNGNHRVQVLNSDLTFSSTFGTVDTSGMVYVSEVGNHRVSVFTTDGQLVGRGRDQESLVVLVD